jgi:hypothetical protein
MLKFVIALAEMFSAFAAKLHDMSEDMPNPIILTSDDVIDIVKEAIEDGDITAPKDESAIDANDIYALDRFVQNEIEEYDFRYTQDKRQFEEQTMAIVLTYMFENGMDSANVSTTREVEAMTEHLSNRWQQWSKTRTERETRKKNHIINDYIQSQPCPAEAPSKTTIILRNADGTLKDVNDIKI